MEARLVDLNASPGLELRVTDYDSHEGSDGGRNAEIEAKAAGVTVRLYQEEPGRSASTLLTISTVSATFEGLVSSGELAAMIDLLVAARRKARERYLEDSARNLTSR